MIYFISGGNRGIGFSFVKQLSSDPLNTIIVSERHPERASQLHELIQDHPNIKIVKLDISNEDSFSGLAEQVLQFVDGVDVLISNAGIVDEKVRSLLDTPPSALTNLFNVNSVGPVQLVQSLYPLLLKRTTRKIVFISSIGSSVKGFFSSRFAAFGSSKVVLNYYMKVFAYDLQCKGFIVMAIHPGTVNTDTLKIIIDQVKEAELDSEDEFGDFLPITPDESVSSILNVISHATHDENGKFFNYTGELLPF